MKSAAANASAQQGAVELGDSFVAYPNPTDGVFYLAWNNSTANPLVKLEMASANTGQILSVAYKTTDKLTTINLQSQPPGIYILRLLLNDGSTKAIQVIRK